MLKQLLQEKLKVESVIAELEKRKVELHKAILNYKFTNGKYKDSTIGEVSLKDVRYVAYWLSQNGLEDPYAMTYAYTIQSSVKYQQQCEAQKRKEEYEARRMQWCQKHGENYALEYEVRHNRNLRDFGM